MPSQPLGPDAWIDAALVALVEGGPGAVAVEPLARALGVTKGSFYWHFADREALLAATVERWAARTEGLVAEVASIDDPRERLDVLIAGAHRSELAVRTMRAMSALATMPRIGAMVKAVARRRHAFLSECFLALGLSPARAEGAARLVHAAYLGTGLLDVLGVGAKTDAERAAYLEEVLAIARRDRTSAPTKRPRRS